MAGPTAGEDSSNHEKPIQWVGSIGSGSGGNTALIYDSPLAGVPCLEKQENSIVISCAGRVPGA